MKEKGLFMKRSRSIAVAQTCPVAGDVQANLDEHVRLAHLAAAEGAEVIVFPELSLTGYELALAPRLAFSEDDPRLSPLLDVAASQEAILVVGAPVRVGSVLHIGAFILSPNRTTDFYTKQRLGAFPPSASCDSCDGSTVPPPEATVFQPGDRNPLIRFGNNLAAVAICADIGRPAHPQQAAERGANIYLASMFVIPSDLEGEVSKLRRYAVQHRMMTALANFGSPSGGLQSAGRSAIWSETGELLVQLEANGSGIAVVTETQHGRRAQAIMIDGSTTGRR
jgi:predicted amidohydrolase